MYLYKLKQKGLSRKGRVEYHEKSKNTKTEIIELSDENERELLAVLESIKTLINMPKAPSAKFENKCKKCAYYEYCFI